MNRLDRLQAILIRLQSQKIVTAQALAERFDVSIRTVYRDIRSLEEAGVPIGAEVGLGYYLVDGYQLPPVHLTREEASALMMSHLLAQRYTDAGVRDHSESALHKIRSVLPEAERDHLESLLPSIQVQAPRYQSGSNNSFLPDLQIALAEKQCLEVVYQGGARGVATERQIEPLGLLHYGGHWHLIGYCRLREDYRDFRVSRIQALTVLTETFDSRKRSSLEEYLKREKKEENWDTAIIYFHNSIRPYYQEAKYYMGFVSEENLGEETEVRFSHPQFETLGRWLLQFGNSIRIAGPDSLIDIMENLSRELYHQYNPKGVEK